jgi:hypothetical protein
LVTLTGIAFKLNQNGNWRYWTGVVPAAFRIIGFPTTAGPDADRLRVKSSASAVLTGPARASRPAATAAVQMRLLMDRVTADLPFGVMRCTRRACSGAVAARFQKGGSCP